MPNSQLFDQTIDMLTRHSISSKAMSPTQRAYKLLGAAKKMLASDGSPEWCADIERIQLGIESKQSVHH